MHNLVEDIRFKQDEEEENQRRSNSIPSRISIREAEERARIADE
jgi:hypothetical protein